MAKIGKSINWCLLPPPPGFLSETSRLTFSLYELFSVDSWLLPSEFLSVASGLSPSNFLFVDSGLPFQKPFSIHPHLPLTNIQTP